MITSSRWEYRCTMDNLIIRTRISDNATVCFHDSNEMMEDLAVTVGLALNLSSSVAAGCSLGNRPGYQTVLLVGPIHIQLL